jgi:hypothetical protein
MTIHPTSIVVCTHNRMDMLPNVIGRLRRIVLTVKESTKKRGWWKTLRLGMSRIRNNPNKYGSIA